MPSPDQIQPSPSQASVSQSSPYNIIYNPEAGPSDQGSGVGVVKPIKRDSIDYGNHHVDGLVHDKKRIKRARRACLPVSSA